MKLILGGRSGHCDPYTLMITDVGYPITSFGSQIIVALVIVMRKDTLTGLDYMFNDSIGFVFVLNNV